MYERMLNKQVKPSIEEMAVFCGENAERFSLLNEWLVSAYHTEGKIVFPFGNQYGWSVAHKRKNKLICNIFAEDNAFTVMIRLSDRQYQTVYAQLQKYARNHIDNRYPCCDGGWIHYRVTGEEQFTWGEVIRCGGNFTYRAQKKRDKQPKPFKGMLLHLPPA